MLFSVVRNSPSLDGSIGNVQNGVHSLFLIKLKITGEGYVKRFFRTKTQTFLRKGLCFVRGCLFFLSDRVMGWGG